MKLSEKSIKIKGLIGDEIDMGTFGLIEMELIEFDKEEVRLKQQIIELAMFVSEVKHSYKLINTIEDSEMLYNYFQTKADGLLEKLNYKSS